MNLRPHRREEPELNLVPMIDVVLVLLIFFMIATSLRNESKLEIRLPESSGQPLPSNLAQLEVDIDASGRYAVNGQWLAGRDAAALKAPLQAAAQGRELPLIVRADGQTPHQAVVTVLDVAGQLGLKQLAIATVNAPVPAPPPGPDASPSPDPEP
ncbi:MAG: biopolymer transporter ExbD [Proteobacteria bacterium]|jgi:biopolymer transport protein ExbD|nr:biopolymer transporter ExbD [Pseudomonadota bacterium]MBS1247917.1 biopolymer transporter ExbD [Pseudomonadota bacterium]MCU0806608.1 biopolymer transporter ExbD [Candidatus Contendobacter sp.]